MHEHVTFLRPEPPSSDTRRISAALPADLLEQVRERVRLLAVFLLIGFAVDPIFYFGSWAVVRLRGQPISPESYVLLGFQLAQVAACAASAALWWVARNRRISASRLHTIGLAYEVVICFVLAITTFWNDYVQSGALPSLTWIPVVIILFPLILPGPPARMLAASIAAGATAPLALALLDVLNKVSTTPNNYVQTIFASTLAVGFAVMGARIVYRLGREVAAARELGSYSLEERLGEGGMGEVWRARHRMLARPAAIKLIHPSITGNVDIGVSEQAMRRFEREAQVIARLRSPHTIELFDFGIADNGAFYYAMELLDGLDADTLVRQFGPIPPERVVYLLRQVCHSLSEAESYGLVHRDIKPANIFLCRYGEECDFVKVLDFGLVKTVDDAAEVRPALTQLGLLQGTPAFMAPEQAMGQSNLDGRVDIYATGCVAYWLLTGQTVFSSETTMGLLLKHLHETPASPSTRGVPVPAALDTLVLSCLAKDPHDRPQSARALSSRLAEIDGTTAWTEDRAREWWAVYQPIRP